MKNKATSTHRPTASQLTHQMQKIEPDLNGGCWLWSGTLNRDGYGVFSVKHGGRQRSFMAHRVMYAEEVADVPLGMVINHKCRVRSCVNPRHLEVVTVGENTMHVDSQSPSAMNLKKTHCPQGHEYTESNTYRAPSSPTIRMCWTCIRERTAAQNARVSARKRAEREARLYSHRSIR